MDKVNISDFKNLLSGLEIEEDKVKNEIYVQKIKKAWPDIIGPIYQNQTEVLLTIPGELIVLVSHNMYKQEILFQEKRILNEINNLFHNKKVFKKISFRIGKIKNYSKKSLVTNKISIENSILPEYESILKEESSEDIKKKLARILDGE